MRFGAIAGNKTAGRSALVQGTIDAIAAVQTIKRLATLAGVSAIDMTLRLAAPTIALRIATTPMIGMMMMSGCKHCYLNYQQ
jgi:hypothetical protein